MENEIILSICCPTYNHSKYIKQALDSILMQKVNFKFEVLVGEDCSPDNTREILQEYDKKYPGFFTMIYRDKNLGSKGNGYDLFCKAVGKYIIVLECDDFWTDENKLQRQVDFLEGHPNVFAVAHKVLMVDDDGNPLSEKYPECDSEYYTYDDYLNEKLPGQTATIMKRNYYKYEYFDQSCLKDMSFIPGDRLHALLYLYCGKVFCMNNVMSAYRLSYSNGTSYTNLVAKQGVEMTNCKMTEFYMKLNNYSRNFLTSREELVTEELYFLWMTRCVLSSKKYFSKWLHTFVHLHNKAKCIGFITRKILEHK